MTRLFDIRSTPIGADECIAAVARPDAGGIDVFLGTVRSENEGQAIARLEYHAYESMAVREMRAIADALEANRPDVRLAALHRIGDLSVGDVAVVCAASAPHRAEAFAACRDLVDQIKSRVPIWKREHGPDGPYWVGWR
jgi:molybdopterin synthase catalytic subunit